MWVPELRFEAILSTGDYVDIRFEGCYTHMVVYWQYDDSIELSDFYWQTASQVDVRQEGPNLAKQEERIIGWASDVVNGKYSWRYEHGRPGQAAIHAVPFATAIKEAMMDVGGIFAKPEEFEQHVLSKTNNASKWTLSAGKFSCVPDDEPAATVTLVIANPAELDFSKFADHTIVYAPESPGQYFLYAIDDYKGERKIRTLVEGWLNDP